MIGTPVGRLHVETKEFHYLLITCYVITGCSPVPYCGEGNRPLSKSRAERLVPYFLILRAQALYNVSAGLCPKSERNTVAELHSC